MLQRAATIAHSCWLASHVRTKQSKWLEQNLQDMGEKVQIVLKLLQEEGDSFAKRAEMYYKKRPELIEFVEESHRAYRALAERYEHLSTELQSTNRTLATLFPEQVQLSMEEENEDGNTRSPKKPSSTFIPKDIPKAPSDLIKDQKFFFSAASKRLQTKKATDSSSTSGAVESGLSKSQALEEIKELQKEILGLQTEKEFVKCSYENCHVKYWEIEERIIEKHDKFCKLQDEFGAGQIIEDDDAQPIMAAAALKSCHETLAQLQEKQGQTTEDAKTERKRIREFWEKLSSLNNEFPQSQTNKENRTRIENAKARYDKKNSKEEESCAAQAKKGLELLKDKVKENLETGSDTSLSVTEMTEKVDEVVDKVVNLESEVLSHAALVKRLREENDDLQKHIQNLEDDRESLISDAGAMSKKLRDMEEKFDGIQDLDKNIERQNNSLQTNFTEVQFSIDHLSEKLHDVNSDEELKSTTPSQKKERSSAKVKITEERAQEKHNLGSVFSKLIGTKAKEGHKRQDNAVIPDSASQNLQDISQNKKLKQVNSSAKKDGSSLEVISKEESTKQEISDHENGSGKEKDVMAALSTGHAKKDKSTAKDYHENLSKCEEQKVQDKAYATYDAEKKKEMLRADVSDLQHGLEKNEESLLNKYITKLNEVEKKNEDSVIDKQLKELRNANAMKDEEIHSLRRKMKLMQRLLDENKDVKEKNILDDHHQSNSLNASLYSLLTSTQASLPEDEEEESKDIKVTPGYQRQSNSPVEEKFRTRIDELLEQNLDFWLRFSTSFNEIKKYESEVRDLQAELSKIEDMVRKQEESSFSKNELKSDARPIYKHLREISAELTVWVDKSVLLKDELKSRSSSLHTIEEEITKALKEIVKDDNFTFTSYQAAKFQGEILNMKQENNKVADELKTGLDHVKALRLEVERTLEKLSENYNISRSQKDSDPQFMHSESHSRVPLRSFIFAAKPKKQRPSLFSCVTPVLYKKKKMREGNSGSF